MANVNSITSNSYSSTNSIYGNRNVLTGLASGMDTEAMIENSIAGYKTKLTTLQQESDKLTWKQEAYRDITDKLATLNRNYTSYTSQSNLYSPSFFKQSTTTPDGDNADAVTAVGKATSNVSINAIRNLATAATYSVDTADIPALANPLAKASALNWNEAGTISAITDSTLTLDKGRAAVTLSFGADDIYTSTDQLLKGINSKLASLDSGITASLDKDGAISFEKDGSKLSVTAISGKLRDSKLGSIENGTLQLADGASLTRKQTFAESLAGKSLNVEFNGVTKKISLDSLDVGAYADETDAEKTQHLVSDLNQKLDQMFGTGVVQAAADENNALSFTTTQDNSLLRVTSEATRLGLGDGLTNYLDTGRSMGDLLGDNVTWNAVRAVGEVKEKDGSLYDADGNLVNASGRQLNSDGSEKRALALTINGAEISVTKNESLQDLMNRINSSDAGVNVSFSKLTGEFQFTSKETGAASKIEFDANAQKLFGSPADAGDARISDVLGDFTKNQINLGLQWVGKENGQSISLNYSLDPDMTWDQVSMDDLVDMINTEIKNVDGTTDDMLITKDPSTGRYDFKGGSVLLNPRTSDQRSLSDVLEEQGVYNYNPGTDARIDVTINGKNMEISRSTNSVDLDGMTVALKKTFNEDKAASEVSDAITFKNAPNTDAILDGIRSFVNAYNDAVKSVHDAFTTQPLEKNSSKHTKYEPLTEDDKSNMSETAISRYEEKAKTGLLFGDSDLSRVYERLNSLVSNGNLAAQLRDIGIETKYDTSTKLTTLSINENTLRTSIDGDAEKVSKIFTNDSTASSGANGLMSNLKNVLDTYAGTSISNPGILTKIAGSSLSPTSMLSNTLQTQLTKNSEQQEKVQTQMSNKIDYYSKMFTKLETMISQMNEQSSALAGLMGY